MNKLIMYVTGCLISFGLLISTAYSANDVYCKLSSATVGAGCSINSVGSPYTKFRLQCADGCRVDSVTANCTFQVTGLDPANTQIHYDSSGNLTLTNKSSFVWPIVSTGSYNFDVYKHRGGCVLTGMLALSSYNTSAVISGTLKCTVTQVMPLTKPNTCSN